MEKTVSRREGGKGNEGGGRKTEVCHRGKKGRGTRECGTHAEEDSEEFAFGASVVVADRKRVRSFCGLVSRSGSRENTKGGKQFADVFFRCFLCYVGWIRRFRKGGAFYLDVSLCKQVY